MTHFWCQPLVAIQETAAFAASILASFFTPPGGLTFLQLHFGLMFLWRWQNSNAVSQRLLFFWKSLTFVLPHWVKCVDKKCLKCVLLTVARPPLSLMAVDINKCCIIVICWIVEASQWGLLTVSTQSNPIHDTVPSTQIQISCCLHHFETAGHYTFLIFVFHVHLCTHMCTPGNIVHLKQLWVLFSTSLFPWQMDLCTPSAVVAKAVSTLSLWGNQICYLIIPHIMFVSRTAYSSDSVQ